MKKRARALLIAVLIGTAFFLHINNAFAVDVWYTVFGKPFVQGFYGENQVLAMAEFGGTIYVGTGQDQSSTHSANVYRLVQAGCKLWECFTPPWSWYTGSGSEPYAMAMIVFNNKLYVGTDQGEVWRTDGLKWTNWENVTGSWPKDAITDMAEFDGYLYISFNRGAIGSFSSGAAAIWRTKDGSSWQPVPGVGATDPYSYDLNSLEVFGDHLYAGVGRKKWVEKPVGHFVAAIALWRMDKNGNWMMFKWIDFPDGTAIVKQPSHVNALKTFKNHLYLGEYHLPIPDGGGLYRTNGSVTSWEQISANVNGTGVYRLE